MLPREHVRWQSVALPTEHGGWGLSAEPALLGLLVAPSAAGALLAAAAMVAFLARAPLRLVLVDQWRGRRLPRTDLARRVLAIELLVLAGLALGAAFLAEATFWWPLLIAVPLVTVALWFDMRSRSRRLLPELAATVAVAAVAPMIVLADEGSAGLAVALWLVMAARAVASMPFVRVQIERLRHGARPVGQSDAAQLAAVLGGAIAIVADQAVVVGCVGLAALAVVHLVAVRRPPVPAKVLGLRETLLGAALVLATALGVIVS
jgi:hypothetical protein